MKEPYTFKLAIAAMLVIVACSAANHGCGTLGPVNWPTVANCAGGVISDVIAAVSRILLADGPHGLMSDSGKKELEQLGLSNGAEAVTCAINRLVHDWSQPGASSNTTIIAGAARGKAFLAEKKIAVQ